MSVTLTRTDLRDLGYDLNATGNVVKIRADQLPPPNGMGGDPLPVTVVGTGPRYRSKWEAERATYWEAMKRGDFIRSWRYEPMRLRLANGAWYKADFLVEHDDGSLALEEVKGFWRAAALVRFKVARELYPMFTFRAVTKRGGRWVDALPNRSTVAPSNTTTPEPPPRQEGR